MGAGTEAGKIRASTCLWEEMDKEDKTQTPHINEGEMGPQACHKERASRGTAWSLLLDLILKPWEEPVLGAGGY